MKPWDAAKADWECGMKYKEIAEKHGVSVNTVKAWATRHWKQEKEKAKKQKVATKKQKKLQPEKVATQNPEDTEREIAAEEIREIMKNSDLTEKQRLFCIYYVKYRNKTKAYQKAFQCSYDNASSHASTLWKNEGVQKEISRLLAEFRESVELDISDLFQWYLDIARADIYDFVEVNKTGSRIYVRTDFDGTLVNEISETQHGIKVKLNDRMKAMDWLSQHIGLADEKMRAEIAALQAKSQSGTGSDAADDWIDAVLGKEGADDEEE